MNETGNRADGSTNGHAVLVVRAATFTCALNLGHVMEVMRPLPVERVAGAPEMVLGLSMIRGVPVPVVALAALFKGGSSASTRFVVVRTGGKQVALAVEMVLGIRELTANDYQALPPLLRNAAAGAVDTIGALDSELFFVLKTASIIPREVLELLVCQES